MTLAFTFGTEASGASPLTVTMPSYTPASTTWAVLRVSYAYGTGAGPTPETYADTVTGYTLKSSKRLNSDTAYIRTYYKQLTAGGAANPVVTVTSPAASIRARLIVIHGAHASTLFGTDGVFQTGNANQLVTGSFPNSVPAGDAVLALWNNSSGRTVNTPTAGYTFDPAVGSNSITRAAYQIMGTTGVPGTVSWIPQSGGVTTNTYWASQALVIKAAAAVTDDTPDIASTVAFTGTLTGAATQADALNDGLLTSYILLAGATGSEAIPIAPASSPGTMGYTVELDAARVSGTGGTVSVDLMDGTTVLVSKDQTSSGTTDTTLTYHFTNSECALLSDAAWNAGGNIFRLRRNLT